MKPVRLISKASSEAAVAKANFDRAEKLQGEQIISQKEFLRVRADYESPCPHAGGGGQA